MRAIIQQLFLNIVSWILSRTPQYLLSRLFRHRSGELISRANLLKVDFDEKFYIAQCSLLGIDIFTDPFLHYLNNGSIMGLDPNPNFSSQQYLEYNRDIASIFGLDSFSHYEHFGKLENRPVSASKFYDEYEYIKTFNIDFYHLFLPQDGLSTAQAMKHYEENWSKWDCDPSIKFNSKKYFIKYSELMDECISPYRHYYFYGRFLGLETEKSNFSGLYHLRSFFSEQYYLEKNLDVSMSGMSGWSHFYNFGIFEGRHPNENATSIIRTLANPTRVENMVEFLSESKGNSNRGYNDLREDFIETRFRLKFDTLRPDNKLSTLHNFRKIIDLKLRLENNVQSRLIKKIAIVYHAFYLDIFETDVKKLVGFPEGTKIFCTTLAKNYDEVETILNQHWNFDYEILVVENHGRDVFPFLQALKVVISQKFQFLLKLHTKRSTHRFDGDSWRNSLVDLLSDYSVVSECLKRIEMEPDLGVFCPSDQLMPLALNLNPNKEHLARLIFEMGLDPNSIDVDKFYFPAGTMFFARVAALEPLDIIGRAESDFETEDGQLDGTLAHAMERAVTFSAHSVGLRTVGIDQDTYAEWIRNYDTLSDDDIQKLRAFEFPHNPLISIIMPVYNTPERFLRAAIDSVIKQTYEHWELCIADDCSPTSGIRSVLETYSDPRIKVAWRESNGHISEASNTAISIATGEWFALMDHDDLIPPHALHCVASAINENPNIRMIYSDEDKINKYGNRYDPHFKTEWNLELFRSYNMVSHLGVYHRSLIEKTGGFRTDFNGAQDYDLALRCSELIDRTQIHHIPRVLYHWRAIEGSTALSGDEKPYAVIAGQKALNEHFERIGTNAVSELLPFGYRTVYEPVQNPPLVSIIIPTRNAKNLVKQCIDSIINKTSYNNFEILLIDNKSDDPASVAYFQSIATDQRITIIQDNRPFNYSALNNNAVSHCKGEVIVLLNNDTEVISPDWIETMIGHAIQPGNGAIGAKLLFPDSRIQHAGVVLGVGGIAGHSHKYFPRNDPGYMGRVVVCSEFSAVTGACLMVRKELYLAVGGLNEVDLEIAYNDVDFCLRLREAGFRNVFTPFAELFHHESATRGQDVSERFERERDYMRKRWGDLIAADPAYSPNLTLTVENFSFASPPRLTKPWAAGTA